MQGCKDRGGGELHQPGHARHGAGRHVMHAVPRVRGAVSALLDCRQTTPPAPRAGGRRREYSNRSICSPGAGSHRSCRLLGDTTTPSWSNSLVTQSPSSSHSRCRTWSMATTSPPAWQALSMASLRSARRTQNPNRLMLTLASNALFQQTFTVQRVPVIHDVGSGIGITEHF